MITSTLKSTGFSMIEMLVAVVVLSIGLLGIASLQTLGQQFNYRAYLRTQATLLAYDIMDRMRANFNVAKNGGYVLGSTRPTMSKDCDKAECSDTDLARYDLFIWYNLMMNNLPDPVITITPKSFNENGTDITEYTLTIQWAEEHGEEGTGKNTNRSDTQIWTMRL